MQSRIDNLYFSLINEAWLDWLEKCFSDEVVKQGMFDLGRAGWTSDVILRIMGGFSH